MKVAQLRGVAAYLPEARLDNEALAAVFTKWNAAKIRNKLGITERPIAASRETALDMGVQAAERLFETGVVARADVDFLLFCTQSPDYFLPTSACVMQNRLGLSTRCGAFDVNLGCSGWVYALGVAKGLVESGSARKVLVVTAETYSKYINELDRVSRPIFGDGAAATLVEASEEDYATSDVFSGAPTFGGFEYGTDGSRADMLIVEAGGSRLAKSDETRVVRDAKGVVHSQEQLYMDGVGIFNFSLNVVAPFVDRLVRDARAKGFEIDAFLFHQANKFMLDSMLQTFTERIESSKFYNNVETRGNTVSSTIPIALIDASRDGLVKPGTRAMFCGFGVGLSWAACFARLPENFTVAPLD